MLIIGCDFHSRFQQIAMVNTETGEVTERRLEHGNGEAKKFYAGLQKPVRVGMEATGYAQWFEQMLAKLGYELWVGNAAEIRAAMVRKQKTDSRDALHILDLLMENRFPRIWIPTPGERDLRQLLWHRHKMVCLRTSVRNQLHALAMGQGICRKQKLWAAAGRQELEALTLDAWARRRRQELLEILGVRCLMEQPGVGPVTALMFVLTIGPVERFRKSKQIVSYLGLNPRESSSGGRQRLGSISKQGNSMVRFLLVEAAQSASRYDEELRRNYQRLKFRRGSAVAKVALARKLAVRLYWKLRKQPSPVPPARTQGNPENSLVDVSPS